MISYNYDKLQGRTRGWMKKYKAQDVYLILKAFGLTGSLRTVQRMMASGELPVIEEKGSKGGIGGRGHYYVVKEEALETFLEETIPYYALLKTRQRDLLHTVDTYEKTKDENALKDLKQKIHVFLQLSEEETN